MKTEKNQREISSALSSAVLIPAAITVKLHSWETQGRAKYRLALSTDLNWSFQH